MAVYQVWWAMVGCLPDGDDPLFEGTLGECLDYTHDDPDGFTEGLTEHNLYAFIIMEKETADETQ